MAEIEFVDQTLRDGQQSLWGLKMRAFEAAPALPHLDRTGFRVIDVTGSGMFQVLIRQFRDDPWATTDFLLAGLPTTTRRASVRTITVIGFGFTPDSVLDLWVQTLVKHGIQSFWLFDCLYDMPRMRRTAQVILDAGADVAPAVMYGLTDVHTDEFFAERAQEMASWAGVKTIYVEDAPGVLTPERAATLLPALMAAAGDLKLELHCHNTTGLAPLVYVEGMRHGITILHTASRPMANGPSLPSTEAMLGILKTLGHTHRLDEAQLPPVAEHFERAAIEGGYPVGVPNEFQLHPYRHQLPGGMMGSLKSQLAQHGMEDRLDEVLDEIVVVREELGQPIMATPFSQFVGIQAVLNIVTGNRYEIVPDEVIQYTLGHYGPLAREVQGDVADRILSQRRAEDFRNWERPQPSLREVRQQFGTHRSDEELLLRFMNPQDEIEAMLAKGPIRTDPRTSASRIVEMLQELVADAGSARRLSVAFSDVQIDLRRGAATTRDGG